MPRALDPFLRRQSDAAGHLSIYARAVADGRHLETRALEHGLASELARRGALVSRREELARALLFEQLPPDSLRTLRWRERPRNLV